MAKPMTILDELDKKYGVTGSTKSNNSSTTTKKSESGKQNKSSASVLDELDKKYGVSGTQKTVSPSQPTYKAPNNSASAIGKIGADIGKTVTDTKPTQTPVQQTNAPSKYRKITDEFDSNMWQDKVDRGDVDQLYFYTERSKYDTERLSNATTFEELDEFYKEKETEYRYLTNLVEELQHEEYPDTAKLNSAKQRKEEARAIATKAALKREDVLVAIAKEEADKIPPTWFDQTWDTAGYFVEKFAGGFVDAVEDTGDFILGLPLAGINKMAGTFGENPISRWAENAYNDLHNSDFVDTWGSAEKRWSDAPNWAYEWGWLPETVGRLAPTMAELYFTGGASGAGGLNLADDAISLGSKANTLNKLLNSGQVMFAGSAAGSGAEVAIDKGADPFTSSVYGGYSAAVEILSEKMFGGLAGTRMGKSFVNFTTKSPALNKALDILGEIPEEWVATGADPALQRLTGVDKNAEWASWADYKESGTHGFILSLVMNTATTSVNTHNRNKVIADINKTSEALNQLTDESATKLQPLSKNATDEEITARQKEIATIAIAYDNAVKQAVNNEAKTIAETAPATLEEVAMEVVSKATETESTNSDSKGTPIAERLEALSQNNEPITVEDVKKATGYGDSGAALVADYANVEGNSFLTVEGKVKSAYMEGMKNPDVDAKSLTFSSAMQEDAYKAGQIDRKASDNMRQIQGENAVVRKDSGFVAENLPSDTKKSEVKALDIMAKGVGVTAYVVAGDSLKGNAEYNRRTGEVPIDANFQREAMVGGKKQQVSIVTHGAHEMAVHTVVDRAPAEGSAFVYALYNNIAGNESGLPVTLAEQKRSAYSAQGVNISLTQAIEEISASNLLYLYNNNEAKFHRAIENIVKDNKARRGLRKYIDSLNIMIAKLKAFLKGASKADRMQIEADMREVIRIRDMFESAFAKAVENTKNAQGSTETSAEATESSTTSESTSANKETPSTEENDSTGEIDDKGTRVVREGSYRVDVKNSGKATYREAYREGNAQKNTDSVSGVDFDLKETTESIEDIKRQNALNRFYSQLDSWDGETTGFSFVLGTTSDALIEAEVPDKQIRWDASKIKNLLNKHNGMTRETIRQIPNLLENPVVVIDSKQNENSRVIMGDLHDENGKLVTVVLLLTPTSKKGNQLDLIKVSSAQGRSHIESLFRKEDGSNVKIRFVDKKRIQSWLNVNRLQLPLHSFNLDSNNIISQTPKSVNREVSNQDSEGNTLTETQQEYFKGSKVRDDNGNLLVMYRGDSSDFSVFDRKKSKPSNLYGRGFYFTNSKSHAGQYGKVRGFYLDIKHPVSTTETTITKSQLRKFLQAVTENEDYSFENYGYGATVDSVLQSMYGKSDFLMLNDVSQTAIGDLVEAVELFNKINGTDYDGIILDTETVTFNSEQAKLTSNENPTSNPDINFSLKEPVEETKNLIAVHNLWEEKLLKSLNLGGFPMPSIAIVRAKEGHSNFGNISLVFRKDTISPTDRRNKVYSGDGWTPTYPHIEYKLNTKAQESIEKKINNLVPRDIQRVFGGLYLDETNMESTLNRSGDLASSYKNNFAMKYAFLLDSGIEIELPMKDAPLSSGGRRSNEAIIKIAETVPEEVLRNAIEGDDRYASEPAIRKAVMEAVQEKYKDKPEVVKALMPKYDEEIGLGQLMGYAEDALRYKEEGIRQEVDYKEASNLIDEKTDTEKYDKWLKKLFSNVIAKEGIRNDKDLFTPSGNRRSFEALHYEHTLENVVKAMKERGTIGIGGFGGNNIMGSSVVEYDSIEQIKEKANERMKSLSQEEYDKIREGFVDRFFELASSLPIHKDSYSATDDAANMLCEAVMKYKTKSGMANYLRNESKGWANYSDYIVDDLIELVNDIRNMPTSYFEAKPQRAVGFNEIATAIIPDNASEELKAKLTENRVEFVEYENGNEQARLEALNSLEDVKFSLKDTDINTKDRKELLDIIEHLKGEFETTKFAKADPKKLAKITRDILKDYNSKADFDETYNAINELYNYMANGEDGNVAWSEVYNRAYEVAQGIVENALVTDKIMYQEYKHLRDYLRTTPMKFTEHDSVPSSYETFTEFRRANMGRLKFTTDGRSIDTVYQELSELYPEFFGEETSSADQLERMIDVLDELQPTKMNPFDGQIAQASMQLANDITSRFFDVPQAKPTFADKAERRVAEEKIKGKNKLDKLREQKNEKIQEKIAKGREKVKETISRERKAGTLKAEKVKSKYESRLAKMSEKQKAKVLRARIIQHTGKLNNTLLKATDQKHIPTELQNAVLALLYNINMESNYTFDPESNSYKRNEKGLPTNKTQAFLALKKVYAEIAKSNDYGLTLASELVDTTNEGVANLFDEVMNLSDTKIADMTSEELTKIYDAIRIIEHSISTANKMFAMKKWEGLKETGAAFDKSVSTRKEKHALMRKKATLDIETPITFFSHFGEAGNELFQALRNAQDNEQVMIDELAEVVQGIVSLEERQKLEKNVKHFTTEGGEKLTLSKAHIMDIYLLYNREQGKKHLLYDPESGYLGEGIHQPEVRDGIHKIRRNPESTRLTKTDIENILAELLPAEKAIADKMQKATLKLAEWGNEACMEVFGYEKFNDPDYWTVKSARESIAQTIEKNKDKARSIKNMGSAKSIEPEAKNPVDVYGVFRLFDQHASDMITYSAWLGVMEDATKLYNFTFRDADGNKTKRTFKSMLEKYAGEGGEEYYFNLLKDIQNGIGTAPDTATESTYTKLYGMAAKGAVAFKLTVTAQQPMAIVRATDVINPLSIIQASVKGGVNLPVWAVSKVKNIAPGQSGQLLQEWYGGWERALKYAPIASRKAIGGYEIGSSSTGLASVFYQPKTKLGKTVDFVKESPLWMAGKADEVTWGLLWNACEIETRRKNKSLEKGSDAFYKATAELFNKVINETQVVDGVLQRSQAMRSSSGWVKPLTTFKGEPTMALNGIIRAYDQLRYEKGPGRGKAIKKFSRSVSVFLAGAVFTAFARSLAVGLTDDEDEEYWDKVWKSFSGLQGDEETWFDYVKNIGLKSDAVNNINPLTWLPVWSDLYSIVQGYSVERLDVASIGKFVTAARTLIDSFDDEGKYTVGYATRNFLLKVAEFTGYSPYNLVRDVEGAIRTVRNETGDAKGLYDMEKWRTKPASNTSKYIDILYKAYSTDNEAYEEIYNDLLENGVDAEKIQSGMETRLKKAEGVSEVSDLSKRFMSPDVEQKYDSSLKKVQSSRVWKTANTTQRKNAEADLYDFLTSTTDVMEKTRAEARAYGVDETEYTLYQLAIEMADQPKGQKGSGSYDMTEKAEAVNSLNLGDREIAYFFGKGLNETAKEEINDVLQEGIDMKEYVNFKAATSTMTADKNAKGNSIPNSKKRKVVNYLNSAGITEEEWMYFYYEVMKYK